MQKVLQTSKTLTLQFNNFHSVPFRIMANKFQTFLFKAVSQFGVHLKY